MQNLQDFFSVEEADTFKTALNSGEVDTVNSIFSSALSRFHAAEAQKIKQAESEELKKAEAALHGRFLSENLKRPIAKATGLKEKDFDGLTPSEIIEKALLLSTEKKAVDVTEIEKRFNATVEKNSELEAKLLLSESNFQEALKQKEQEFNKKSILLNWFSGNSGVLIEAFSAVDALELVERELSQKGVFFYVENGQVLALDAKGQPLIGEHNKILSAKDILESSTKLKAIQKSIAPISPNIQQVQEQKQESQSFSVNPEEFLKLIQSQKK